MHENKHKKLLINCWAKISIFTCVTVKFVIFSGTKCRFENIVPGLLKMKSFCRLLWYKPRKSGEGSVRNDSLSTAIVKNCSVTPCSHVRKRLTECVMVVPKFLLCSYLFHSPLQFMDWILNRGKTLASNKTQALNLGS